MRGSGAYCRDFAIALAPLAWLSGAAVAECSSCGAAVLWVTMRTTGKKNPLDATPSEDGNVRVDVTVDGAIAVVVPQDARQIQRDMGLALYKSHFATCPQARQHRKPKGLRP